jgi:hypothetical protein
MTGYGFNLPGLLPVSPNGTSMSRLPSKIGPPAT